MPSITKILHIVHSLRPGGMENGVVNIARKLSSKGIRTDVCCLDASGDFAKRLPPDSQVHVLSKPEGFRFSAVRKLANLIRHESPEVVHAHCLGPLTYAGLAKIIGPNFRLLMGEHGSFQPSELLHRRLLLRRMLYHLCESVHTVSQGLTDELHQRGFGFANPVTIVNGVDTERFSAPIAKEKARVAAGLPENAQVIGIVGRFIYLKRHDMLLDAFDRIACEFPHLHLLIVGSRGDAEEKIHARVSSSPFENRIHLSGFTPEPELYYRAMDLMVMPSEKEGMSNALLESMACGVPTLCSDACGNSEVIVQGRDGLLVDLPDATVLASHLAHWLSSPQELKKLGENARSNVVKRFSLDSMSEAYYDLYESVISNKQLKYPPLPNSLF